MSFWWLIIAYPNGGQWAPSAKSAPLAQISSYATGIESTTSAVMWQSLHLKRRGYILRYHFSLWDRVDDVFCPVSATVTLSCTLMNYIIPFTWYLNCLPDRIYLNDFNRIAFKGGQSGHLPRGLHNLGTSTVMSCEPLVKAGLTYLMWIIIKIVNINRIRKQRKVFSLLKLLPFFLFLLKENYNQQNKSSVWAKVNFTGP